ncbi:MDIS1-interacting receptor like kinase 2-like [Cryptomeria japonica]|uniref:MDIS1-interacting receptor like kinase 2-like n=1 Tax=Cryptomeria japonica TaxID=3369 RepID=UPI0027DA4235|nr:MDIS1-interacting receptor like kinase 2-like [Cryptomeria japonica]
MKNNLHNQIKELQVRVQNLEVKIEDYKQWFDKMGDSFCSLCAITNGIMRKETMGFVSGQSRMKKKARKLLKEGLALALTLTTATAIQNANTSCFPHVFERFSLTFVSLTNNLLTGEIPEAINGELKSLITLALNANYLTGKIPKGIGELKSLGSLYLNENNLFGPIPPELGNCTILLSLCLQNNHLTGKIPKSLGELKTLSNVYLYRNDLTGAIPLELGNCTSLFILILNDNYLTGKIPEAIGELKSLVYLYLNGNNLTGPIPYSIGKLSSLSELILIPPTLSNCAALKKLKLSSNSFNGNVEIQFSSSIQVLSAHSNNFSWTLSASLVNCTQLTLLDFSKKRLVLDLSNNKFGGRIPSTLEDLKGFKDPKVSQLGGTALYEEIPAIEIKGFEYRLEYVSAANTILDLSNNNLKGEIPPYIGNLSQLRLLKLSGNQLEGAIPASLGQIEPLEQLDLSQNSLNGEIPEELSLLSKLSYWNVSFNHLCGPVPAGKQLMTFDEKSYQGNPKCLCGYPLQSCKQNKSSTVPSPSKTVGKSVWSKVDKHISVIAVGLGFGIGLGGIISIMVWWDRLLHFMRGSKIRGLCTSADSQTCSWSLSYNPHFSFFSSTT